MATTTCRRTDIEADLARYTQQAREADERDYPIVHAILDDLLTDWQQHKPQPWRPSQVLAGRR